MRTNMITRYCCLFLLVGVAFQSWVACAEEPADEPLPVYEIQFEGSIETYTSGLSSELRINDLNAAQGYQLCATSMEFLDDAFEAFNWNQMVCTSMSLSLNDNPEQCLNDADACLASTPGEDGIDFLEECLFDEAMSSPTCFATVEEIELCVDAIVSHYAWTAEQLTCDMAGDAQAQADFEAEFTQTPGPCQVVIDHCPEAF